MNFGEKIKMLREEKKLTQNTLASLLNISKANISRYELGVRQPSIETVVLIAKFFNVSIDWLFGRSNIRHFSSADAKPRDFSAEDLDILEFIKGNDNIYEILFKMTSVSDVKIKVFCEIWNVINKQL